VSFVWLELDNRTNLFHAPGTVPVDRSQGLFRFGADCARVVLERGGQCVRIRQGRR
jgi:hypothetical protein